MPLHSNMHYTGKGIEFNKSQGNILQLQQFCCSVAISGHVYNLVDSHSFDLSGLFYQLKSSTMNVETVFRINGEGIRVKGTGQEAVNAVRKEYPRQKIVLVGFSINGEFMPADLI